MFHLLFGLLSIAGVALSEVEIGEINNARSVAQTNNSDVVQKPNETFIGDSLERNYERDGQIDMTPEFEESVAGNPRDQLKNIYRVTNDKLALILELHPWAMHISTVMKFNVDEASKRL